MRYKKAPLLVLAGFCLVGCSDPKEPAPVPPPAKSTSGPSVDSLLGNDPPPAPVAAGPQVTKSASKPVVSPVSVAEAEASEYANWDQSSRKADWEKMLQLYVGDNKGRFPGSIEELAKAYGRPLPPLPPGAVLVIDRTNKTVRMKRF